MDYPFLGDPSFIGGLRKILKSTPFNLKEAKTVEKTRKLIENSKRFYLKEIRLPPNTGALEDSIGKCPFAKDSPSQSHRHFKIPPGDFVWDMDGLLITSRLNHSAIIYVINNKCQGVPEYGLVIVDGFVEKLPPVDRFLVCTENAQFADSTEPNCTQHNFAAEFPLRAPDLIYLKRRVLFVPKLVVEQAFAFLPALSAALGPDKAASYLVDLFENEQRYPGPSRLQFFNEENTLKRD